MSPDLSSVGWILSGRESHQPGRTESLFGCGRLLEGLDRRFDAKSNSRSPKEPVPHRPQERNRLRSRNFYHLPSLQSSPLTFTSPNPKAAFKAQVQQRRQSHEPASRQRPTTVRVSDRVWKSRRTLLARTGSSNPPPVHVARERNQTRWFPKARADGPPFHRH